jgi:hypothetical protein
MEDLTLYQDKAYVSAQNCYLSLSKLTSLPASRKTPLAEKIPTLDALPITPLVLRIQSVLNTILYVFPLQILDCSKKNTIVLVVLSIVPSTMSSTASCLHPYCTASINIILNFGALGLQVQLARRTSQFFVVSRSLFLELQVCPYRLTGTLF